MTPVDPALMPACHDAVAAAAAGPTVEGWLPAAAVLLAGLLGTMMPCTVQMAVILSSLLAPSTGDQRPPSRVVWLARVSGFLGGYILTFLAAAGLAALLVQVAGWVVGISTLQVAGGLVLAAFGLQMLGWVRLPGGGPCGGPVGFFLGRPYRSTPRPGRMGMTFAVYCAGCCGPAALGSALLLGGAGSAVGAAFMLLVYAAGMAIPFIVLAAGLSFALRSLKVALRYAPAVTVAGGCVAVIAGVVLALKPLSFLIEG
jgi:cytochrome c-type biogenesis protein